MASGKTDRDPSETVEVRVRIAARPSTVFEFLSDPERVKQWMGRGAEFRAARDASVAISYPNGDVARGTVLEVVPDRRVVFSYGYENGVNEMAVGSTRVSIELTPIASGTLVTLRHSGIPRADVRRGHAMGWRHYMSALANVSASVAGVAEPAVDAYLAAWAEVDAEKRAALLATCWAPEAIFRDAMGYAEGREELSDYIGAAQRFAQGARLERDSALSHAHGFVSYRWRICAASARENSQSLATPEQSSRLDQWARIRPCG